MLIKNIFIATLLMTSVGAFADTESEVEDIVSQVGRGGELWLDILITSESFRLDIDQRVSETIYSEAALQDLTLIAESHDWSLADAKAQRKVTDILKELGETLRSEIGDNYLGAALSSVPGQIPTVYIKGEVDELTLNLIPEEIRVYGHAPYTVDELRSRQNKLRGILINFGYGEIATSIDLHHGSVRATVLRPVDGYLNLLTNSRDVKDKLPESLQSHVSITIETESFANLDASYGGINIRRSTGTGNCTTGWVVEDGSGNTGVTTAAHCTNMGEIEHWGNYGPHDITLEDSHFGSDGDISWYSTDTEDLAYFYFNNLNQVRRCTSSAPTWTATAGARRRTTTAREPPW